MTRCLLAGLVSMFCVQVSAGQIEHIQVQHHAGTYLLELDAIVAAEQDRVYEIATDDEHLDRLSNLLIESTLISNPGDPVKRRRLVTETCVLFFCFKATAVEEVREINNTVIISVIDATQSDFNYGKTRWEITPANNHTTHVRYQSKLQPAFWVPPLIGPWAIKNKMRTEAGETIAQLEKLAGDD